jgi:hypothetical protein
MIALPLLGAAGVIGWQGWRIAFDSVDVSGGKAHETHGLDSIREFFSKFLANVRGDAYKDHNSSVLPYQIALDTEMHLDKDVLWNPTPSLPVIAPLGPTFLASSPRLRPMALARAPAPVMGFFGGGNKPAAPTGGMSARDADFARRQDKLAARRATGAAAPKGQVEVTFPQKGNKVVTAMQGDPIGKVCQKAGMRVKFDCKTGRCATCQVSLNGRSKVKVCQGATIPGGATRKLKITLDNP